MKYEVILENPKDKDVVVLMTKTLKRAKELYIKNMMKERVIVNRYDEIAGTTENVLDNKEYWELIEAK